MVLGNEYWNSAIQATAETDKEVAYQGQRMRWSFEMAGAVIVETMPDVERDSDRFKELLVKLAIEIFRGSNIADPGPQHDPI